MAARAYQSIKIRMKRKDGKAKYTIKSGITQTAYGVNGIVTQTEQRYKYIVKN